MIRFTRTSVRALRAATLLAGLTWTVAAPASGNVVSLTDDQVLGVVPFATAAARTVNSCIPGNFWELDETSANALAEVTPIGNGHAELRFDTQTSQLQSIAVNDVVIIPQTAVLPTGFQGPVSAIATAGSDITLTVSLDRFPNNMPAPSTSVESTTETPELGDPDHTCMDEVQGEDTDGNQLPDSGDVNGSCAGTNGGEQGFKYTLADGIEINGLASVAPFEIEGNLSIFRDEIDFFRMTSTSRLSFTGEISAESDYTLPDNPWLISGFPVATYQLSIAQVGTVTIQLNAKVLVGACGTMRAGMRAGLHTTAESRFGLEWIDTDPPRVFSDQATFDIQVSPPELDNDTGADITLYGGVILTMSSDITYGGFIPVAGANVELTARGNVNLLVEPASEPWWQISATPEVYLDVVPELLLANLQSYTFQIVEPDPVVVFSSQNEFPFTLRAPSPSPVRAGGPRRSGDAVRWSRAYLADSDFRASQVSPTDDGGAFAVGDDQATGTAFKTDFEGNREWQRLFDGDFLPLAGGQLQDGGYFIAGRSSEKLWVMRLDAGGGPIWSHEFDFTGARPQNVFGIVAPDGDILLGGELIDTSTFDFGPWAAKFDLAGNLLWAHRYGQPNVQEEVLGMTGTADGGLLLVGESDQTPVDVLLPGSNAYTLRLASDGDVWWSNVWSSSNPERLYAATQASDGSYLVGGITDGNSLDQSPRGLLIRYDAETGGPPTAPRWIRGIGPSLDPGEREWDEIRAVTETQEGFLAAGNSLLGQSRRTWLAKIVERGDEPDMAWSVIHDGIDEDAVVSLHDIGDGLLLGGDSRSFAQGASSGGLWITRLPYEAYLHWNDDSQATGFYSEMVEDVPPSFPATAGNLNIALAQDTTSLEQQQPLGMSGVDSTTLVVRVAGFAQRELIREPLAFADSDADSISDDVDNCTARANPDQRDSNGDGYGNACDADLNDDGIVNAVDLGILRSVFFSADQDADLNGDGVVNGIDLGLLKLGFFAPPGPSGLAP